MDSVNDTFNTTDIAEEEVEDLIPSRKIQFWTILCFQIPSLACTIFLFYHLLVHKNLRKLLHNHVIIILLFLAFFIEVIDNSLYLDAYRHQGKSSFASSPFICLMWLYVDYGFYGAVTIFLAWGSFERHILIFHRQRFLATKMKRITFHYLPLGMITIYTIGFYLGVVVFPPCENIFDYEVEVCGMAPCYEAVPWLNLWDYMINGTMCTLIEAVCSISLLIRVLRKRCHVQRAVHWKKHRKMTIQLLSISTLSLSITLPQALITIIRETAPQMQDFGSTISSYLFYMTTYVVLLLPFVSLGSFPELWPKLSFLTGRRQGAVAPFKVAAATVRNKSGTVQPQITLK